MLRIDGKSWNMKWRPQIIPHSNWKIFPNKSILIMDMHKYSEWEFKTWKNIDAEKQINVDIIYKYTIETSLHELNNINKINPIKDKKWDHMFVFHCALRKSNLYSLWESNEFYSGLNERMHCNEKIGIVWYLSKRYYSWYIYFLYW